MSIEQVQDFLLMSLGINYGVLLLWALLLLGARDWMYRVHHRFYRISKPAFDIANYAGLGFYKLSILLFNLVPYVALRLVA